MLKQVNLIKPISFIQRGYVKIDNYLITNDVYNTIVFQLHTDLSKVNNIRNTAYALRTEKIVWSSTHP